VASGAAPKSKVQIGTSTAIDEGPSGAGAWANFGSNSYFDGVWKRLDESRAGVNLHMNADDGVGQEFRFLRSEANGTTGNVAVVGTQMSYMRSARVGIGTTAPEQKLHVEDGSLLVRNTAPNATTPSLTSISLANFAGQGWQTWTVHTAAVGGGFGVAPNALEIWEYPAGQPRFQIKKGGDTSLVPGTGNLGIGTSTPSHKFHVYAGPPVGLFESSGNEAFLRISTNEGLNNRVEVANRPGGRFAVWVPGFGDAVNVLRDGRVGIGTTTPGTEPHLGPAKLHVAGHIFVENSVYSPGRMHIHGEETLYLLNKSGTIVSTAWGGSGSLTVEGYLNLNNVRTWLKGFDGGPNNGYHWIKTTDEAHMWMGFSMAGGQPNRIDLGVPMFGAFNPSDERLKTDLQWIDSALERVNRIRCRSFEWRDPSPAGLRSLNSRTLGVIAQDVAREFPELVTIYGADEHLAVDNTGLSAVLVQAVKDLTRVQESLRKEVSVLWTALANETRSEGSRQ